MTALIYSGTLNQDKRTRLALEAQAFNILTDREKRNFIRLKDTLGDDILSAIDRAVKENIIADDGKPIIKESRFETFQKNYQKYKELYLKNATYDKFCSWWFERHLLGYSYSNSLYDCFKDTYNSLVELKASESITPNERFVSVGIIDSVFINRSYAGNRYAKLEIVDDYAKVHALFCDNQTRDEYPLSEFLEENSLEAKDIIVFSCNKNEEGTIFIKKINKIKDKIFTNTRQLK